MLEPKIDFRPLFLLVILFALAFSACGPVTIDIGGSGGNNDQGNIAANQTMFILLIVLLVAMVAMVFVAMSSR